MGGGGALWLWLKGRAGEHRAVEGNQTTAFANNEEGKTVHTPTLIFRGIDRMLLRRA